MIILEDFTYLEKEHFDNHDTIVILARYNFGKSSFCTDKIFEFLGDNTLYLTFTDQSKPSFTARETQLEFGDIVKGKTIVFDEISDDKGRDVERYLKELIQHNKVIILSNLYGSNDDPLKEIELFKQHEKLEGNVLYIYIKNKILKTLRENEG